ncbi:MAG: hypothetical protein FWD65_07845, partial [Coriobacteriia bacterium]|nr:hypothetical protein [Coriobacteriia bacterium]
TKKKVAASAAAVLIAALLLGGAFAWTDFSQAFKNLFHGTATPDVLLHDDFDPGKNKDVYVENTGETDLVVRVQFAEFLQVGNDVKIGTDAKDSKTWRVRQWAGVSVGSDGTVAANDNLHDWLMSGAKKWYLPGTSEIGDVEYNGAVTGGNGNTTKETLTSAPVILLSEYIKDQTTQAKYDADNPDGFWILDDSATGNGWCYWSKLLPAGEATNLLLDNVTVDPNNKPDDNYAYNIDVRLQAANKTEAYKLGQDGDISPEAKGLTHDLAADVITTKPDGVLVRSTTIPDVWEILDASGTSKNPREYVYDGDHSLTKDKSFSGDELPCDKNGVITCSDGTLVKGTDDPHLWEIVNPDGSSKSPKQYRYSPTGNPNDTVGDGPEVTGQDGGTYIQVGDPADDTYLNTTNGLTVVTPPGEKPGGPDDVVQTPTFPTSVADQAIKFRVLPVPTQYPGSTCQVQVEFYDSSQEAAAQPLRYLLQDSSVSDITINSSTGEVTVSPAAGTNKSYTFYVIAADGSFATGSFSVQPLTSTQASYYQALGILDRATINMNKGAQSAFGASGFFTYTPSSVLNYAGTTSFTIQGPDLGCTLTSAGIFTAGNTAGTVTVQATISFVNKSTTTLALQDGSGRRIAPGVSYTLTTTFEVNVQDPPTYSAEAQPYITKLTDLGVTNWNDVEPAPAYAGGNGSQGQPYLISSIRQLKRFVSNKGSNNGYAVYFKLTANMDFDGADTTTAVLLGNLYGNFDGDSHVIKGLTGMGIFGTIAYGTVQNLGRTGGTAIGNMAAAFAASLGNGGTIIKCYNEDPISGVSGFVGTTTGNATIDNCYNKGAITDPTTGTTSADGGLVRFAQCDNGTLTIKNSYNAGDITGLGANSNATTLSGVGGIIGYLHASVPNGQTVVLDNVRNYGQIIRASGVYTNFGDIIGKIVPPTNGAGFQKVNFTGTSSSYLPGLISYTGFGVQSDTDIGDRLIAESASGITISGSATNTLTGPIPTGFLVP